MTKEAVDTEKIRKAVIQAFHDIAPDSDLTSIDPDSPIRDQLDIDSMDQLNIMIRLHELLGIDIPEADYARMATLNGMIHYLASRGKPK